MFTVSLRVLLLTGPLALLPALARADKLPLPELDPAAAAPLIRYIEDHGLDPIAYVAGKFDNHDVVFVGEAHCIRHDGLFVQQLVPALHARGVYTLATEFARRVDQSLIDSVITAPAYDEAAAREIVFRQFLHHGMHEYVDLFRAAWQVNQGLEPGQNPFRILGINDAPDWSHVKTRADRDNDEVKRKVWQGQSERDWAQVILNAVEQGDQVLVYCGIHHAFTEFAMPVVNQSTGEFIRFYPERVGNYVFETQGKRAITVALHAPWFGERAQPYTTYAVGGVIDALMHRLGPEHYPVGFDTRGTPWGKLPASSDCLYIQGRDSLTLEDWCDGYVFHMPISEYQGMTPITDFVNESNLKRAQQYTWNPNLRSAPSSAFQMSIWKAAQIQRKFNAFH